MMRIIVISTSLLLQWQLVLVHIIQKYEQHYINVLYIIRNTHKKEVKETMTVKYS